MPGLSIENDVAGRRELPAAFALGPELEEKLLVAVEDLNVMVVEVGDEEVPTGSAGYGSRAVELTASRAAGTEAI